MSTEDLTARAQALWCGLAEAPVAFATTGMDVAVSPSSLLCPPGWVGIVAIGGAAIATAPDERSVALVRKALVGLSAGEVVDPDVIRKVLPVAKVLGPAALAYVDADSFRPAGAEVTELDPRDPGILAMEALAGEDEAGEASLDDSTSPAFAVVREGAVAAASGYRVWAGSTAHIGVLTAPEQRGRGLAKAAGSASTAHALAAGLLPQWRARIDASRSVARALGFSELGAQLSVELG
ncbi:GNAT family N-acetyltransferase [Phytomonospora sp. NPDC050363]|uniref:GNAT family N-acetyltransferase n=1 Tax=Phytomonospora sp. NPDC050363 TaxID=3155642 RepID=UPI0033DE09D7